MDRKTLDYLILFGLIIGIGSVIVGNIIEGGTTGHLVQAAAAFIVFGGTLGAIIVSFPSRDLILALKGFAVALTSKSEREYEQYLIDTIINLLVIARRKGYLALEEELNNIYDKFLRESIRMIIDGYDINVIREVIHKKIKNYEEEIKTAARVFESAGGYAPTIGIIGAVLGLIHVLQNVAEPSKIGSGIAVAFVATIYGVGSANLLFIPISKRIIQKSKKEIRKNLLILKGIEGIEMGVNPNYLKDILNSIRERQL